MGVTLTRKEAIKMLTKIGAYFEEGSRHIKVRVEIDGKKVLTTVISRGSKEIPTGTAKSIFRELGLGNSVEKCLALKNCPLQREEYIQYLRSEGVI
jgi:predicted RNA binding protein YcfA (HicA-like mRNA interferase family)